MAKMKDGTLIMLTQHLERERLRRWRQLEQFYCPQCNGPMRLKVGDIMMPHFAHEKEESCSAAFSEGETKEHLQGKQQLFNFFVQAKVEVELEPYFKGIKQRPDLIVSSTGDLYPIEFQCSTIQIAHMQARTAGYEKIGMKPIWIMNTPEKFKQLPQGVNLFKFSRFEEAFFNNHRPEGLVFLTYDPQYKRFHYFSTLLHIGGRQYIGVHRILPITMQIFPFARPKLPMLEEFQQYYALFKIRRRKFLTSRIFVNRRGVRNPFLQKCYELRIIPSELPLWIGVPIDGERAFIEHPCEWQLDFVFFAEQEGLNLGCFEFHDVARFVQRFEGTFEKKVEASLKYSQFLASISIESLQDDAKFDESLIEQYLPHYLQSEMKIEKI